MDSVFITFHNKGENRLKLKGTFKIFHIRLGNLRAMRDSCVIIQSSSGIGCLMDVPSQWRTARGAGGGRCSEGLATGAVGRKQQCRLRGAIGNYNYCIVQRAFLLGNQFMVIP